MFVVLAVLSLLAGVFLLGLAWLSGHRTIIPTVIKPLWFWVPGVALLSAAPVFGLIPSVVTWNQCSNTCSLADDDLRTAYESCVLSSRASVGSEARKVDSRTPAQVAEIVERQVPAIEAQCAGTILGTCTTICFNDWWDPKELDESSDAEVAQ